MAAIVNSLPLARRRLDDAVHALADPVLDWHAGVCRTSPALYVGMRGALRGSTDRRSGVWRSVLPCRADVLGWLVEVDGTVAAWEHGKGTIDRLHQHAARGFRVQDCAMIDSHTELIERWVLTAVDVLADTPKLRLEVPCPSCGTDWAYRREAGDVVRERALRVDVNGCLCGACGVAWAADQFHFLARLLGCDPLPT